MSRTFSTRSGSCDSRNDFVRWGFNPNARQIRPIVEWLNADIVGHRACAPVRTALRRRLERFRDDGLDFVVEDGALSAWPRLIVKTVESMLGESASPLADSHAVSAQCGTDIDIGPSRRAAENDLCAECHQPRTTWACC